MNNRLINTKVAAAGGCTDIVDDFDPFDGNGVALWQFNNDATDVSGNYDGNASAGMTYAQGVFGNAIKTTNETYFVDVPNLELSPSTPFSFSCWAYTTDKDQRLYLYNFLSGAGATSAWGGLINGKLYVNFCNNSIESTVDAPQNTWFHFAVSYDGSNAKVYLNGAEVINANLSSAALASNNLRMLDTISAWANPDASLDQVRYFNTALDPLEIEALYTEELCICDGTVDTLQVLGDTSCIATYQLDGNANDLSGQYSGEPTDVSYGVGEFDLAGVFNGSSSQISIPNGVSGTGAFSVSVWINSSDITNAEGVWSIGVTGSSNPYAESYIENGLVYFRVRTATVSYFFAQTTSGDISANTWHNIVYVFPNTTATNGCKIYVDGQEVAAETSTTGSLTRDNTNNGIGSRFTGGAGGVIPFSGSIDQVRIFNKALDQNDVDTLFAETACTYGGRQSGDLQILGDSSCVAYYKLDGNADDVSGNYNGTFANANYANGEFLYAGVFNGTNAYVTQSNSLSLTDRTFSAWVKFDSFEKFILGTDPGLLPQNGSGSWDILPTASGIQFIADKYDGSTYSLIITPNNLSLGIWYHIVFTAAPNDLKAYINGQLQTPTLDNTRNIATIDLADVNIGRTRDSSTSTASRFYFDGEIDQVRIFNKAINQSEVNTLYNEGL